MAGDAEVQFGNVEGQHSAFALADFAPIFLYRANDNVLFEAGFDFMLPNGTALGTTSGTSSGSDLQLRPELCARLITCSTTT